MVYTEIKTKGDDLSALIIAEDIDAALIECFKWITDNHVPYDAMADDAVMKDKDTDIELGRIRFEETGVAFKPTQLTVN